MPYTKGSVHASVFQPIQPVSKLVDYALKIRSSATYAIFSHSTVSATPRPCFEGLIRMRAEEYPELIRRWLRRSAIAVAYPTYPTHRGPVHHAHHPDDPDDPDDAHDVHRF